MDNEDLDKQITDLSSKIRLLKSAYEVLASYDQSKIKQFIEDATHIPLDLAIDEPIDMLVLKTPSLKHTKQLWTHKDLISAISPTSKISILSSDSEIKYLFKKETIMNSASEILDLPNNDIIKEIDDSPYSSALSTWSEVLLYPNSRIILYPDRPTYPDETIRLFGHQMGTTMHPEDRANLYRESRQNGVVEMKVRKKYHTGVWGVANMICRFVIYRGHECRYTQVTEKTPIEPNWMI